MVKNFHDEHGDTGIQERNAEQDRIMSGRNAGSTQQTAQILDLGTQEVDSGDNDGNRAFIDAAAL